ncbi:hypothetical protein AB0D04_23335 [Streptomyces sp. NPDC048483]|uniref:hypothetical protein n=1 Tax=Streptomyces sp. NPDC048483 TaxID=3154927 RepID=UPI00342AFF4A
MRNRTAQLLTRLLRALAPSHGRHRRTPMPPLPIAPPAQARSPRHRRTVRPGDEAPLWDTPLVRPYLTAYERGERHLTGVAA